MYRSTTVRGWAIVAVGRDVLERMAELMQTLEGHVYGGHGYFSVLQSGH